MQQVGGALRDTEEREAEAEEAARRAQAALEEGGRERAAEREAAAAALGAARAAADAPQRELEAALAAARAAEAAAAAALTQAEGGRTQAEGELWQATEELRTTQAQLQEAAEAAEGAEGLRARAVEAEAALGEERLLGSQSLISMSSANQEMPQRLADAEEQEARCRELAQAAEGELRHMREELQLLRGAGGGGCGAGGLGGGLGAGGVCTSPGGGLMGELQQATAKGVQDLGGGPPAAEAAEAAEAAGAAEAAEAADAEKATAAAAPPPTPVAVVVAAGAGAATAQAAPSAAASHGVGVTRGPAAAQRRASGTRSDAARMAAAAQDPVLFHFHMLAVGVKAELGTRGTHQSVSHPALYDLACAEGVNIHEWPRWIRSHFDALHAEAAALGAAAGAAARAAANSAQAAAGRAEKAVLDAMAERALRKSRRYLHCCRGDLLQVRVVSERHSICSVAH
jgi:hypothetical protein